MNKLKVFATLLLSAFGIFGANEYYKPKNVKDLLKWRGIKLASGNKAWKSMFFENEKELIAMGVDSANSLWSWCLEKFKSSNLGDQQIFEDAKKYCSDNAKSIMGRIIKEGEESKVIKSWDNVAFSINYLLSGNKEEVLKLINFREKPEKLEKIALQLSKWCKEQERESIITSEDLEKFSNFKKRCYDLGVRTFAQLLKKQGRTLMKTPDQFRNRFEGKLEHAPKLIEELRPILNQKQKEIKSLISNNMSMRGKDVDTLVSDNAFWKSYGWILYKSWCDGKWNNDLINSREDLSDFGVVSYRCTEEVENN